MTTPKVAATDTAEISDKFDKMLSFFSRYLVRQESRDQAHFYLVEGLAAFLLWLQPPVPLPLYPAHAFNTAMADWRSQGPSES
jgi:hypothetical protein